MMYSDKRYDLFRIFASVLADNIFPFEEEDQEGRHRENQIIIERAIALTDLSLDLLDKSSRLSPYQLVIPSPRYQRGDRVILTCGDRDKSRIEIIDNSYFDFDQGAWIYELQSDHSTYYPESDLSTNL